MFFEAPVKFRRLPGSQRRFVAFLRHALPQGFGEFDALRQRRRFGRRKQFCVHARQLSRTEAFSFSLSCVTNFSCAALTSASVSVLSACR